MKPKPGPKPGKLDKKHPSIARDAMEDIKDISGDARPVRNDIRYSGANRDRSLGEIDRTGRHFDSERQGQETKEPAEQEANATEASEEHEGD